MTAARHRFTRYQELRRLAFVLLAGRRCRPQTGGEQQMPDDCPPAAADAPSYINTDVTAHLQPEHVGLFRNHLLLLTLGIFD